MADEREPPPLDDDKEIIGEGAKKEQEDNLNDISLDTEEQKVPETDSAIGQAESSSSKEIPSTTYTSGSEKEIVNSSAPAGAAEEEDDDGDLFKSALSGSTIETGGAGESAATKSSEPEQQNPDFFAGGGDEITLDDDADDYKDASKAEEAKVISDSTPTAATTSSTPAAAAASASSSVDVPATFTIQPPTSSLTAAELITKEEEESDEFYIEISVTNPHKIGDGMGAYVAYDVSTRTNYPEFKVRDAEFKVNRRFSDFLGLHARLQEKHVHYGRIVPPAPEKSVVGMTKVKMSKGEATVTEDEFVKHRQAALGRFLLRVAQHPMLRGDVVFRDFLEKPEELPKATSTSALSGAGVKRLISKVGDSMNKMTFKMDESDQWFEEKQTYIENLDSQLKKLHGSVEILVNSRRELSSNTGMFAKSTAMLGLCEEHTSLSRALSQLAETEERLEEVHLQQADADFLFLAEVLKDYVCLLGAVKAVFYERVKIYQTWQNNQALLTKKRENEGRLQLQGKQDKVAQAQQEVKEFEDKVEKGEQDFDSISRTIRREMERFETARVKDFRNTIVKYLELSLEAQEKQVKLWETFLPEAKAIS